MNPAFKLTILIAVFFVGIIAVWLIGFSIPIAMVLTLTLLVGLIGILLLLLFFIGAFQFSGKGWFWKLLRIRRKRGALDYVWIVKGYGTGGIRIDLDKIGEEREIKFGNQPDSNKTYLGRQHHYEVDSRLPLYICIEGTPHSVSLLKKFEPSQASMLVNQTVLLSHAKGKLEALGLMENLGKKDIILYLLVLGALVGIIIVAFFSMQNSQSLTQIAMDVNSSMNAINSSISVLAAGG